MQVHSRHNKTNLSFGTGPYKAILSGLSQKLGASGVIIPQSGCKS